MARKKGTTEKTIENRRAGFDYSFSETLEVGIVLSGSEVKSVRGGLVSLAEGYVRVQPPGAPGSRAESRPAGRPSAGGLFLHSVHIAEYGPAGPVGNSRQHRPERVRTLLAHKREIEKLAKHVEQKGATIIPLKLYFKNGYAKLLIGVGMGKTRFDKRQSIAERETKREISRAMSRRQ